jgi:hypothetical protein
MIDASYRRGVEKIEQKGAEEVYLLLKDIQMDIQNLYFDERMQLTRNQWAAISRIHNVVKELT